MSANNNGFATVGCLSEHLNYFSDNLSKQPMLEGDFDALFNKDFDMSFDPFLMMNSDIATVARPVNPQPEPQPQMQIHAKPQPVAMPVPSSSFVPLTKPCFVTSNPGVAPVACVTPAVPPKPVMKAAPTPKKVVPPHVSPNSVTAVFQTSPVPPKRSPAPAAPKSSPRKRSYSMVETVAPASPTFPMDTSNMSYQEQENLRRERNRHHAKKSRQRKRNYMTQLEEGVNEMRKENERLFELLGMNSRQAKAGMAQEEERKVAVATEKFIVGLKQPRNRVLDNTTLAFLRELWK